MSAIRPRSRIRDRPRSTDCTGPGDRRTGQRPRRRQGGRRLQEAQPRLGHRRRRAHHRCQPRQPMGPGLRAGDARVGLRQRDGRLDAVLRRRAQEHPRDPAARGRHPRRRSDRGGVQRHRRLQGRRRAGALHLRLRGRDDHGVELGHAGRDRGDDARRGLQGPGHRQQGQRRRCSTPRTSTRARSTSSTTRSRRSRSPGGFVDPNLPAGFAPFNVQEIAGRLVVAYAQQDPNRATSSHGPGLGYVDVFDTSGHLLRRLISQGALNAPWGLAVAPRHFGPFSGDLLVGNFGDGAINAYDPRTRRLPGHADEQGRQPDQDQRPVGAALRQRRDRHAADAAVHRRASATRTTASSARSSSAAAAERPDGLAAAGADGPAARPRRP